MSETLEPALPAEIDEKPETQVKLEMLGAALSDSASRN